jgi:hypothetical protein
MFLFYAPIVVSSDRRNDDKMSVVITLYYLLGTCWAVFNIFKAPPHQHRMQLFDTGNEGNDGSGYKTLNCCCSSIEKDGDMIYTCSQWH